MADGGLTLELFGTFRAAAGGSVVGFRTDKARALLAYLAVEADRPHLRTSLATLLWPDMPDEIALRNLRKTLHRLHEALEPVLGAVAGTIFHASRQTIQLHDAVCTADVAVFEEMLETSAAHAHRHLHLCEACLERLTHAASLYRGELLAGFGLPDAEPFEEWLLLKRELFQHQALAVLHQLAAAYLEREEYERAHAFAARQVELDPGREEAHRQVMRALALGGQRAEALAYFERAERLLLDTLGVEPAPETVEFAEGIKGSESGGETYVTNRSSARQRHNLPAQLTPFVGRKTELLRIAEHFLDPECRVVSIVGPGGMGKTRLAIRAAEHLVSRARFPDGVHFIALAEVRTAEQLPAALLTGLGLELDGGGEPRTQLLHYLAGRECLLVLDNIEQLLDGVDLLVEILATAPHVRLLITSRLPLGLQAEQRVPLDGLDYPGQPGEPAPVPDARGVPGGEIAAAGSVQLFVQAAHRVEPAFALSAENEGDVLQICHLVGGMPLALELAAPWIRAMDCAAIAGAIRRSFELLATQARDVPHRQRSIEGVFGQSWDLLTPRTRAILAQLSVFRGPFDMEAAGSVAGATVLDLASLLDTGLLHRRADGRYGLHELVRQFVTSSAVTLPDLDLDAVRDRHSTHYLGLVAAEEETLYGPDARRAVSVIGAQRDNLREAWRWAAERGRQETLTACLEGMTRFWELTAGFEAAETLLAGAASSLQTRPDAAPLLIRLGAWLAHFHEMRNRLDDAMRAVSSALELAERCDDPEGVALARSVLGEILPHRGEMVRAAAELKEASAYFAAHDHPRRLARALSRLGAVYWRAGDYSEAAEHLNRTRALHESLGDSWELARVSSVLAGIAFEGGDLEEAQIRAEAALRLYEITGDRLSVAGMRGNLALIYRLLGRFELALQHNSHDLETSRELGDRHAAAVALGNRASIFMEAGKLGEARACFREALYIEESLGNAWDVARHRAGLASLLHLQGEWEAALAHFEEALPVLRARDARYYRVIPLLDAAELQLDRGRVVEAAELTREGAALAGELDLHEQMLRARILEARIASASGEQDRGARLLQALLTGSPEEPDRAAVHYELWRMSGDRTQAETALQLYGALHERRPRDSYRRRIDELTALSSRSEPASAR